MLQADLLPRLLAQALQHLGLERDLRVQRVAHDLAGGLFRFEVRELSKASFALLTRRLERLAIELNEMAELDGYLPSTQRDTIGMALGIRPYVVSWAMGLKPR